VTFGAEAWSQNERNTYQSDLEESSALVFIMLVLENFIYLAVVNVFSLN